MKKLLILLCVGIFASAGCTQKPGNSDRDVIAEVNKTAITKEDFLEEISRVPEWARNRFKDKEGKEQFLDELIKKELIYQDAKKKRLHKDEEFMAKVEKFEKMTLLSIILKKEVEEKTVVDDTEVKDFYDKNPDNFRRGAGVRASHILVDTEEGAKDILSRVKKGESFSKLAKTLSKDKGSAQKGGDLDFFSRGRMVPEFEEVAFSLKKGEVSDVVKTRFGYHIIKVTDKKGGPLISFEETKNTIRRQLLAEKQKKLFESYVENLKTKSKITKNEDILVAIPLPWEQTEGQELQPGEKSKVE